MILADYEIKKAVEEGMIENFVDAEKQLQQSGFDLTVKEIYSYKDSGSVDFSNEERELPAFEKIDWGENEWAYLPPGVYKVKTNEVINMPKNLLGICQTRTTLLRMGVTTNTGFWDPGFKGRSEFALTVTNPKGVRIKKNARIVQIAFLKIGKETEKEYEGVYKHLK